MATQLVPTMSMRRDPNPRGSATSTATMSAANPFEREVARVRPSNQGSVHAYDQRGMLPGMAGLGAGAFDWEAWAGEQAGKLLTNTIIPLTSQAVGVDTGPAARQLQSEASQYLPVTTPTQPIVPPQSQYIQPPLVQPPPASNNNTKSDNTKSDNTLLYVGIGVAVLAIGGAFMMSRKRR